MIRNARSGRLKAKVIGRAILALWPLVASPVHGAPRTWLVDSGSWGGSPNWTGAVVPQSADDAFVTDNDSTTRTVSFRSASDILSLQMNNSGTGNNILSHITGTFTAASEEIGTTGRGQYDQLDGTNNITGGGASQALTLGVSSFGSGGYNLSGGSVNSSAAGGVIVGKLGFGTFGHSGGVHIISGGALKLGDGVGARGTYELSNGTTNVSAAGGVLIGSVGVGTFKHSGGVHIISNGALKLGDGALAAGAYELSGTASLTANSEFIGNNGTGSFQQTGGMNLVNGNLTIASNPGSHGNYSFVGGSLQSNAILINSNGQLNYNAGVLNTFTLSLNGSGRATLSSGGSKVLRTNTLLIDVAGGSKLDLSDNAMIWDYSLSSRAAAMRGFLAAGYAAGAWTGNGATSSAAATVAADGSNSHKTALGYAEASDLFTSFPASFVGQSVDDTSVLVRYTLYGDANLDKTVDTVDFNLLAASFSQTGKFWNNGDFNYDGVADTVDFNLFASNFSKSLPSAPAAVSVLVPEAASAILALGLAAATLRRRRKTSTH